MYKKNQKHLQPTLFSSVMQLPEKYRQRLDHSWAGSFYRDLFCRLDEDAFGGLYADCPSRPNAAVNVLVGLEVLKAGYGWSDEELYEHFLFDVQVRYALGLDQLGEDDFELRTLYNFRQRLSHYNQAHQVNLLQQAFADLTDQQLVALQVKTGMQRIDSVQLASNIVDASRLQLLVEAVQRLFRVLSEPDQTRCAEPLAPYLQGSAGQYVYHVRGKTANQAALEQIGAHIHYLLTQLRADYADPLPYQVLERFFQDNFRLEADLVQPKPKEEISAGALQSVDALEATFRRKAGEEYQGYVAAVSETCDPENPLQWITHAEVDANNVDDAALLVRALPQLQERMEIHELHSDGGFGSPAVDEACQAAGVEQVQSALRGKAPDPEHFSLADFDWAVDERGKPQQLSCPGGQTCSVEPGRTTGYVAYFDPAQCQSCPFTRARCRAQPTKREPRFSLHFTQQEVHWARRRRRQRAQQATGCNLRAAVEATMRSVKHPFPGGKLPVRGLFRVTCIVIASAAMTNLRRIQRYRQAKRKPDLLMGFDRARQTTSLPAILDRWGWLTLWMVRSDRPLLTCFDC
jgi:hypothetical protein